MIGWAVLFYKGWAEIDKNTLNSHMARRTFIANIYNKVPDPNVIGSMTGHVEGSRAFARYRTIEEEVKKSLVDILG